MTQVKTFKKDRIYDYNQTELLLFVLKGGDAYKMIKDYGRGLFLQIADNFITDNDDHLNF